MWFWVLTCSDGFCLLYFLVPCPGSVKRNQWWFSWTVTEVKSNLLLCQRLKRNTNLTSLDSDIGGKRQSGNRHTPCSHLRECPLFFSLCTKCRCCCVSTWDQQANVFFIISSCNKNEYKNRIWKISLFKYFWYILLAYMHCIQGFSKSFFYKHITFFDHIDATLSWSPFSFADFLTLLFIYL